MHSHFVERTNERTARKFTSYLSLSLSLSLSLFLFLLLFLSLPRSLVRFPPSLPHSLSLYPRPFVCFSFTVSCLSLDFSLLSSLFLTWDFARVQQAGPDQPVVAHTRFPLSLSLSLFPPSPSSLSHHFPLHSSCHHRNSGWKSLNCTHSHARALCSRCDDLVSLPSSRALAPLALWCSSSYSYERYLEFRDKGESKYIVAGEKSGMRMLRANDWNVCILRWYLPSAARPSPAVPRSMTIFLSFFSLFSPNFFSSLPPLPSFRLPPSCLRFSRLVEWSATGCKIGERRDIFTGGRARGWGGARGSLCAFVFCEWNHRMEYMYVYVYVYGGFELEFVKIYNGA